MDVSLTKVKCYLTNTCLGGKDEIRLFKLDLASASCYTELVNQLSLCYTEIGPVKFSFVWRDEEGEDITVSSNEELLLAGEENQGVLKLYATVTANPTSSSDEAPKRRKAVPGCGKGKCGGKKMLTKLHVGVVCDGCEGPVKGPRFKCSVCPDFDLCKVCRRRGTHKEHEFYRIPPPRDTCPDPTFGNLWSLYNSNQAPQPFPAPPPQSFPAPPPQYSEQATETTPSLSANSMPPPENLVYNQGEDVQALTQRFSCIMNETNIPAEEARSEGSFVNTEEARSDSSFVNIAEPDERYYGLTFDVDNADNVDNISLMDKVEKDDSSTDGDFDLLREEFSAEKLAQFRMPEQVHPEQVHPELLPELMPTERLISFTEISSVARPEEPILEEHTLLSLTKTEQTLSWEPEQPSLLNYPNPAEVPYHVAVVPYRGQTPEQLTPREQSPIPRRPYQPLEEPTSFYQPAVEEPTSFYQPAVEEPTSFYQAEVREPRRPYQQQEEPRRPYQPEVEEPRRPYQPEPTPRYRTSCNSPTLVPLPPHVKESLKQMTEMGYSNNGGWLGKLLLAKKGDVSEVIDILHNRDMAKRT